MKKLLLRAVAVCLALSLGFGYVTEADAAYRLRLQVHLPAADRLYSEYIAVNLVEKVRADTDGQVIISTFPSGALVPPTEIFRAVADGVVDIGYTAIGYHAGFIPSVQVVDGLPMAYRDYRDLQICFNERGLGDLLRAEYEKNGVILLTQVATDAYTVLSKAPLSTQADWQGAKVRGFGVWNKYFSILGASAVEMPLAEVYMALALGTVDAAVTGVAPLYLLKFYETCKNGIWPPLAGTALQDIYINPRTWNNLPEDLRNKVMKSFQEWAEEASLALDADSIEARKGLEAEGVVFAPADNEWLLERAQVLWQEIAETDEVSAQAIKIVTDYLREVGVIN